jgi:lysyl-tRNA synthetase class 2
MAGVDNRINMPSTVIRSIEYNAATAVLTIVFIAGTIYEYYDVPAEVYEQLKSYREKGVFYNKQIKNKYRFARTS